MTTHRNYVACSQINYQTDKYLTKVLDVSNRKANQSEILRKLNIFAHICKRWCINARDSQWIVLYICESAFFCVTNKIPNKNLTVCANVPFVFITFNLFCFVKAFDGAIESFVLASLPSSSSSFSDWFQSSLFRLNCYSIYYHLT